MTKFYLIPGLGCDKRVFQNCLPFWDIQEEQINYLEWKKPLSLNESIGAYAERLAKDIPKDGNSIIIGLSLGGMVATELAKIVPNKKLFIISSIKHQSERPWILNLAKKIPLYHLMPSSLTTIFAPRLARWLKIADKESSYLFADMIKTMPTGHIRWARHNAINWYNEQMPENYVHIHGDKDHIFNQSKMQVDYILKNATHNMILDRSEEVAKIIHQEIKKILP